MTFLPNLSGRLNYGGKQQQQGSSSSSVIVGFKGQKPHKDLHVNALFTANSKASPRSEEALLFASAQLNTQFYACTYVQSTPISLSLSLHRRFLRSFLERDFPRIATVFSRLCPCPCPYTCVCVDRMWAGPIKELAAISSSRVLRGQHSKAQRAGSRRLRLCVRNLVSR